jgi:hypothetical protein
MSGSDWNEAIWLLLLLHCELLAAGSEQATTSLSEVYEWELYE